MSDTSHDTHSTGTVPGSTHDADHEHEVAHIKAHIKLYVMVGLILFGGTIATVALSYFDFGSDSYNIAIAMLLATVKVCFVGCVFMHLWGEKRMIFRVLIFAAFFSVGMFYLTKWHFDDPIHGTTHWHQAGVNLPQTTDTKAPEVIGGGEEGEHKHGGH